MSDDITQEELQAELDAMNAQGKHSIQHKSINRKVSRRKLIRGIAVSSVTVSLLICIYVWLRSAVGNPTEGEGGAYQITIGAFDESGLELSFDPNFNEAYLSLSGLGYGNVDSVEGGSLLAKLAMNTTMFDKFKNLAENEDMASIYDGSFGSANFDQYYANKYYLRNVGDTMITYRINLEVSENTNNALSAARFMLVSGDAVTGYDYRIFATPNTQTGESEIAAWAYRTTALDANEKVYFANPNTSDTLTTFNEAEAWRCENLVEDPKTKFWNYYSATFDGEGGYSGIYYTLLPGQSVCYTLCVWYEGSDPDHNNSIANGGIEFTIYYEPFDKSDLEVKSDN